MEDRPQQLPNGVKNRMDGAGDAWAFAHRTHLPCRFTMSDIDGLISVAGYAANTGDRLFAEYIVQRAEDEPVNVNSRFAIVALFDRKTNYAARRLSPQSHWLYMHFARALNAAQPIGAKFFYVFGGQHPPWILREVNVYTGEYCGEITQCTDTEKTWLAVWRACGLLTIRDKLEEFLRVGPQQRVER